MASKHVRDFDVRQFSVVSCSGRDVAGPVGSQGLIDVGRRRAFAATL